MKRLFPLFILLLLCSLAWAWSTSGTLTSPTVSWDPGNWTSTDNIFSSNNSWAGNTGTSASWIGGNTFGLSIQDSSIIDSIIVTVEGYSEGSTTARRNYSVRLSKDGGTTRVGDSISGTMKANADSTMTIRGSTNGLWGTTWTEAEIEAANFTVCVKKVSTNAAAMYIDYVAVKVYWHSTYKYMEWGRGAALGEVTDGYITEYIPTTNYGTSVSLVLGGVAGGSGKNVMFFGVGRALADSLVGHTVDSAKMTLYNSTNGGFTASPQFSFYTLRRHDVSVSQCTYNIYSTGNNWGTAGASNTTTDIFPTAHNTFAGSTITALADFTVTATNAFKVIDGAAADTIHGLWLVLTQSSGDDEGGANMSSADNATAAQRPFFRIWAKNGIEGGGRNPRRERIIAQLMRKGKGL